MTILSRLLNTQTPLVGGISLKEAERITSGLSDIQLSRKNLFLLEVSSKVQGDFSESFNLFAVDVEYAPITLAGDKHQIGAAQVDGLTHGESVELNITSYDDKQGSLWRWFNAHADAAVASDGTVGLPGQYAIKIRILHGFINRESNNGGWDDRLLFRPSNLNISKSRQDDALSELQMSFAQLDAFMPY